MREFTKWFIGPLLLVGSITVVGVVDLILPLDFRIFGLIPRSISGLTGVITMPFLHGGIGHYLSNLGPLFILSLMVSFSQKKHFYSVTLSLIVSAGLLTWLISTSSIIVGASGLVFGFWSFLIAGAVHNRDFKSLIYAAITVFVYGYMIFAFSELKQGVSYAAHFSGLVCGVLVSKLFSK